MLFHSDGTANAGYAGFRALPTAVRLGTGSLAVTAPSTTTLPPPVLVGSSLEIRWTSTGSLGAYVSIELLSTEGAPAWTIAARTANDGSFVWSPVGAGECDFASYSLCGWQNSVQKRGGGGSGHDTTPWRRQFGRTPTGGTGPAAGDHTGGGYFLFLEASGKPPGTVATLESPSFAVPPVPGTEGAAAAAAKGGGTALDAALRL